LPTLYKNLPDEDLMHRIALKQDKEAFSILFERYKHIALGVCLKYLGSESMAKEAVQGIFLKIWTDSHQYSIQKFKAWLYKVIRNHCLMELRKKDPGIEIGPSYNLENMEWEDNLHLRLNEEQLLIFLNLCLRTLNQEQHKCITCFYLEQKSYRETAEATGYPDNEVKSYIQTGRRNLKNCLHQKLNREKL
jgi:RNA polymerase sigma-70 factor (ECF subfamily)